MVYVAEADEIIKGQLRSYGTEAIRFEQALGRVLAEDIVADRNLPPYNRVTMDGIAISFAAFEQGVTSFRIIATQAAGDVPPVTSAIDECVEIMTGAALPETTDTVIRYEDLEIKDGIATVLIKNIIQGQSIHHKGKDKKQGDIVVGANQVVTPAIVSMLASTGYASVQVKKQPRVVIISTGDELVGVEEAPSPYEVRRSNNYTVKTILQQQNLIADMLHLRDEPTEIKEKLQACLQQYDVIILSGGISMGKFDYVPVVLEELNVNKLFHKVRQRPGNPFWFGAHENGTLVFALPGNPVSTFMCTQRYFVPWYRASMGIELPVAYAVLDNDITFTPALQYFVQVKLSFNNQGHLLASTIEGNGSGDFANLTEADAFMELPLERNDFKKGEVYRVWPFKQIM